MRAEDLISALANASVKNYSYDADGARNNVRSLETPNGRLGFVQSRENYNPNVPSYYGGGVDNLGALLGDNYYYNDYNLPLGMSGQIEYDGDTLAGGVSVPTKEYYVAALLDLLNNKR